MAGFEDKLKPIGPVASTGFAAKLKPIGAAPVPAPLPTGPAGQSAAPGSSLFSNLKALPSALAGAASMVNRTIGKPLIDLAATPVQGLAKLLGKPDPYANGALGGVDVNPIDKPLAKTGSAISVASNFFPYGKAAGVAEPFVGSAVAKIAAGAAGGYAADVGSKLSEKQPLSQALKPGVGTAVGAALPAASEATKGVAGLFGKTGDKIMNSVIKPSQADIKDGFHIDTVKKYQLGGSLRQSATKTESLLDNLSGQLQQKLAASKERINLAEAVQNTENKLGKNKLANFGANSAMSHAIDSLKSEIKAVSADNGGTVSIPDAQTIKRASGHFGAWLFGTNDPDANARQKVYNTFYNELKTQIEQKSPAGVKEINKQLSEVIPVMNALIRRIPVAERNNALSLTDVITLSAAAFEPRALALTLANLGSKSGRAGAAISNIGHGAAAKLNSPTARGIGDILRRASVAGASKIGAGNNP